MPCVCFNNHPDVDVVTCTSALLLGNCIKSFPVRSQAGIAQLGERQTEDLKVPGSIPGHGRIFILPLFLIKCQ